MEHDSTDRRKIRKLRVKKMIIATITTSNSETLICEWLKHHENIVDEIIATDNASVDGTLDMLNDHPLVSRIIHEPKAGFLQELWVTRMARIASLKNPDWIIHCDHDELWGNLDSLTSIDPIYDAVVSRNWRNHLPVSDSCKMSEMPNFVENTGSSPLHDVKYFGDVYSTARKIIHRPNSDIIIGPGNHTVRNWDFKIGLSEVEIDHYPVRSFQQFETKVTKGNRGFHEASQPAQVGNHWREWYDAYQNGTLKEVYSRMYKMHEHPRDNIHNR